MTQSLIDLEEEFSFKCYHLANNFKVFPHLDKVIFDLLSIPLNIEFFRISNNSIFLAFGGSKSFEKGQYIYSGNLKFNKDQILVVHYNYVQSFENYSSERSENYLSTLTDFILENSLIDRTTLYYTIEKNMLKLI